VQRYNILFKSKRKYVVIWQLGAFLLGNLAYFYLAIWLCIMLWLCTFTRFFVFIISWESFKKEIENQLFVAKMPLFKRKLEVVLK